MKTALPKVTKLQAKIFISLLIVVTLAVPPLANFYVNTGHAAGLTSAKVEIGDSRAGVTTLHRFQFVTPSTTQIKTIVFQYCTTASGACTAPTGMALTAVPTLSGVAGIGGTTYSAAGTDSTCNGTGNTDCTLTLTVGTPGAQGAGSTVIVPVTSGITNPTGADTTYFVRITTRDVSPATIDGPTSVAFAVLTSTSLAVSATVDPNLTFEVNGVADAAAVNGATTTVTTGDATIPFGTLVAGTPSIGAHDVVITTNAGSGYTVTASHAATAVAGFPPLVSGSNDIDAFTGGGNSAPVTWSEPAGSSANTSTGFFGYTTNDSSLCVGTVDRFTSSGGNKWAGSSTVGGEVACSTGGVSAQTTRVGWQVEVNGIQPAGSYTGTAILVATPTY